MTEAEQNVKMRERVRRLFNTDPIVRADAQDALKDSWAFDAPSFQIEELASHPAENCSLMAARRDGQKEVLTWLMKL